MKLDQQVKIFAVFLHLSLAMSSLSRADCLRLDGLYASTSEQKAEKGNLQEIWFTSSLDSTVGYHQYSVFDSTQMSEPLDFEVAELNGISAYSVSSHFCNSENLNLSSWFKAVRPSSAFSETLQIVHSRTNEVQLFSKVLLHLSERHESLIDSVFSDELFLFKKIKNLIHVGNYFLYEGVQFFNDQNFVNEQHLDSFDHSLQDFQLEKFISDFPLEPKILTIAQTTERTLLKAVRYYKFALTEAARAQSNSASQGYLIELQEVTKLLYFYLGESYSKLAILNKYIPTQKPNQENYLALSVDYYTRGEKEFLEVNLKERFIEHRAKAFLTLGFYREAQDLSASARSRYHIWTPELSRTLDAKINKIDRSEIGTRSAKRLKRSSVKVEVAGQSNSPTSSGDLSAEQSEIESLISQAKESFNQSRKKIALRKVQSALKLIKKINTKNDNAINSELMQWAAQIELVAHFYAGRILGMIGNTKQVHGYKFAREHFRIILDQYSLSQLRHSINPYWKKAYFPFLLRDLAWYAHSDKNLKQSLKYYNLALKVQPEASDDTFTWNQELYDNTVELRNVVREEAGTLGGDVSDIELEPAEQPIQLLTCDLVGSPASHSSRVSTSSIPSLVSEMTLESVPSLQEPSLPKSILISPQILELDQPLLAPPATPLQLPMPVSSPDYRGALKKRKRSKPSHDGGQKIVSLFFNPNLPALENWKPIGHLPVYLGDKVRDWKISLQSGGDLALEEFTLRQDENDSILNSIGLSRSVGPSNPSNVLEDFLNLPLKSAVGKHLVQLVIPEVYYSIIKKNDHFFLPEELKATARYKHLVATVKGLCESIKDLTRLERAKERVILDFSRRAEVVQSYLKYRYGSGKIGNRIPFGALPVPVTQYSSAIDAFAYLQQVRVQIWKVDENNDHLELMHETQVLRNNEPLVRVLQLSQFGRYHILLPRSDLSMPGQLQSPPNAQEPKRISPISLSSYSSENNESNFSIMSSSPLITFPDESSFYREEDFNADLAPEPSRGNSLLDNFLN